MKSILSALVATALLGSISLADEIDDQIQRLEKENKLLELQNKKKQLEMNGQIVNQNADSGNNSLTSQNQAKVGKKASLKNGWFVGVEGVLGGANVNFNYEDTEHYLNTSTEFKSIPVSASGTTFDMGLVGGYQHYFGDSQRHGIKISAHLYSGVGNTYKMDYDELPNSESYTENTIVYNDEFFSNDKFTISYIPIKFGFDVKYLYDFFERGKHTLGLNVGVGYEFDAYVGGKENLSIGTDIVTTNTTDHTVDGTEHKDDSHSYDLDNIYSNAIYPIIGLHYYYGHHQFELLYRFGGVVGQQVSKTVAHDHTTDDENNISDTTHKISLLTQSYLTFNYTYRF